MTKLELLESIADEKDLVEKLDLIDLYKDKFDEYPSGNKFIQYGMDTYGNKMNILRTITLFKEGDEAGRNVDLKLGSVRIVEKRNEPTALYIDGIRKDLSEDLCQYADKIDEILHDDELMLKSIRSDKRVLKFYLIYHLNVCDNSVESIAPLLQNFIEDSTLEIMGDNITSHLANIADWFISLKSEEMKSISGILEI